ncbi:MAG TPA: OmpA family protein [Paraburkholderia sp.]|jgi:OOP family OmpA-OmpF porin|nr:OmpA family protein [Paraburkholderia sp.]
MKNRSTSRLAASAAFVATCFVAPLPVSAQIVVLTPPAPPCEPTPPPHAGCASQHGYWSWQPGGYVWMRGQWAMASHRRPAPPPPPAVLNVIRLEADALFRFDRGDIRDILPGGHSQIRTVAAKLRTMRFSRIEVRGYTDRIGPSTYNLGLSQRRASAVKALLVDEGVPPDRIDARGFGEQDPVTQCGEQPLGTLVACLQPDRRVEIVTFAQYAATRLPPPHMLESVLMRR